MAEEKKVEPQGEIPPEGRKEIKTPPRFIGENFVGPASSSSGQAKRADPIKPEEPRKEKPVTLSAEAQKAKAETAKETAKPAEEKKPEEKAKPEEVKAPEVPPKEKKRKKVRNTGLEEIEKKLKETEEKMGGLQSKYAQHLLQRKEELLKEQEKK